MSENITESNGVKWSNGVHRSNGMHVSYGVNWSDGVNLSNGVNESDGVNRSNGVNVSFGIINSFGVDNALFLADKPRTYSIFGLDVSKERFHEVRSELITKLDGWYPKFNNAFHLYVQNGNDWSKVDASKITGTLNNWEEPYEAWKDMPQEAIDYVASLPEFNADIFKRITGIDVSDTNTVEVTANGKTVRISRKSAEELGLVDK